MINGLRSSSAAAADGFSHCCPDDGTAGDFNNAQGILSRAVASLGF